MATGIGIGIAGDVFQEKAGAGIGPDPFLDMYSVQFDGVDEYLTASNAPAFGTGDFTINFWSYRTSTTGSQKVLSKTVGSATEFQIAFLSSGGVQWSSTLWPDGGGAGLISTNDTWEMWSYTVSQSTNTATWYKNGANPNVKDITGLTGTFGDGELRFGRYNTTYNYAGNLDEISFWNVALTGANLLDIYNSGKPNDLSKLSFAANLTNWWRMGDPQGPSAYPTIVDSVGSADMTMTNMASSNITTNVP